MISYVKLENVKTTHATLHSQSTMHDSEVIFGSGCAFDHRKMPVGTDMHDHLLDWQMYAAWWKVSILRSRNQNKGRDQNWPSLARQEIGFESPESVCVCIGAWLALGNNEGTVIHKDCGTRRCGVISKPEIFKSAVKAILLCRHVRESTKSLRCSCEGAALIQQTIQAGTGII